MEPKKIPITKTRYDEVEREVEKLKVESKKLSGDIARARDLGDLSENAEYHAAREQKGMVEAKVAHLRSRLASYEIVDENQISTDSVQFGTKVTVHDSMFDEEVTFAIVGESGGESPEEVSVSSPVGKALMDKKVGDEVEVQAPRGTIKYKILKIEL